MIAAHAESSTMSLSSRLLLSFAAATVLVAPAVAADYSPPIFVEKMPDYVPVEIGSGWYLRGDITYTAGTRSRGLAQYRLYNPFTDVYTDHTAETTRFSENFGGGIGVGYSLTDWFRTDVTIDASRIKFAATDSFDEPCPGSPLGTECRLESGSQAQAWSFLANAYVDLGTVSGFTPYLGAGAGYTYLRWRDSQTRVYCTEGVCDPPNLQAEINHGNVNSWRFTYAAMAGLAYDVSNNVKIDLGYRYRRISGGSLYGWDAASADAGASGVQARDRGFRQHQIRVGLRYELW
jgi:opacity protein-like surface antigen